jgi:hypothetical protein
MKQQGTNKMADVIPLHRKDGKIELVFCQGDVLVRGKDESQLFVLAVEEGGDCAVLVPIEPQRFLGQTKPTYSATLKEMAGWKPLYMPGPRFVQAFHVRSHKLMWEAYVPGIVEALHLADEIYHSEGREIDLLIHTQHHDEDEMLFERGYWGEGSVPPGLER